MRGEVILGFTEIVKKLFRLIIDNIRLTPVKMHIVFPDILGEIRVA